MANPSPPVLPPNLCIFSPSSSTSSQLLSKAKLFTRLTLSSSTTTAQLATLSKDKRLATSYSLVHRNGKAVLIFDAEVESKDADDVHHDHFREVCLALKDLDVGVEVSRCVHDAKTAAEAGFQLERLRSGDFMIIDLMVEEDDADDDASSDEDDGELVFETTT